MSQVTTLAGSGTRGFADGSGTAAHFNLPQGVAVGDNGDIIVADSYNHRIRMVSPSGAVTTFAGSGVAGFADGQGLAAQFNVPTGLAVTKEGWVVVADTHNNRIRTITPEGHVTTLAGGNAGFADGVSSSASFLNPCGIAIDHDGNIIVADTSNHRIRLITPAGQVSTLAGSGEPGFSDGNENVAQFDRPGAVAVDNDENVIVGDQSNHRIRKVSPQGKVSTIAGIGDPGFSDGMGSVAMFYKPSGVSVDGDGNIIVADMWNHRVRMLSPEGQVTTIAGNGNAGYQDGMGTAVSFKHPVDVVVDGDGNIIVMDLSFFNNQRIRKIAAQLTPPGRNNLPALLVSTHETERAAMLEDLSFADVVFQVEETQITAHKAVLASHSAYFKAMLSSGFKESQSGGERGAAASDVTTITIGDTTPSAFKSLLRYLYTDVFEFEDEDILSVMSKAKEFQLERLYNQTVRYSIDHICVENVVLWLIQSDALVLEELRESTLQFLARNVRAVRASDANSLFLFEEKPRLLIEVMLAIK
jgi:sugar lactone lactonase YvrE